TANRGTLIAGTYTLTVTDANSCTAVATTTVTQPAGALTITAPTVVPVSCFGGSNGGITTATTGGTTPYTYLWNGGATTANRTSLTAGSYSVTVTDANNCTASIAVTITQPSAPLGVSLTKTDALCNGANSGSITSIVSGGTTGYTYIWSNSFTNQNLANVPAGVYTVTVEDANLCTASSSVTVGQPTAITITETHTNVVCNGNLTGAIDITPTGGTGNYTYNWTNGSNAQDLSGIAAGNYTITVTDANNCTASQTILVIEPSAFNVSLQYNNVSCNGGNDGNINLTVSGSTPGYTFQWNNQATTEDLNNIPAGNYFVIIRDANNCVANANLTITQPNSIVVVTNTHTNVSCFGGSNGSIDITIQGGTIPFTFIWSDGVNTEDRTNLSAGTYQLTVNDVNSCAVSQPVVITEPTALNVTLSTTNVSCFGGTNGTITSIVTGGTTAYSYSWNTGSTQSQINNVSAANYSLTVTDSQGCQQIASTAVTQPVQLSINGIKTDVTCSGMNNGSIDVLTSGGVTPYVFNWSNNAVTEDINNLSPATYTITATDANNCSLSSSWAITQPQPLQAVIAKQDPSCNGAANGLVDLTVNGGTPNYTFVWNSNSSINTEDIANAIAGTYAVAVTDANGCLTSASTVLNQPAAMAINTTSTMPSCFGGADGSIQVSIIGGTPSYIYNWSNGASTAFVQNLSAGSYSLTVTDANGCTASQNTVSVSEPSLLGVGIQVTNIACFGASTGAVQATITGGTPNYTYMWSNNATTKDLSNVAAGSYQLTVTDSKGCTANANAFINTLPPMLGVGETDNLVCAQDLGGVDLTITQGTAPYTYQWSNGSTNEDLTNVGTGTYYVQVTDANGCKFDTSFTIINTNQFSVTASGGGTIILGEYVDLSAVSTGSPQTTYQWTPNFGFPCATCTDVTIQPGHSTTYTVVATDVNGCIAQDTVSVTVIVNHEIFTPNAFTPNGDGNNDIFQLYGNLAAIKKFDLMIFDRWGEKVFDAVADPYFKWDGTYKGATLDPQVLVYVMKVTMLDGTVLKTFKGSITILR
ncbi:MAG: gliding motility-associated C-terminal domain-containing protein, partial [Chitinophagales bacterium]|nr:gliding motility-associated C-terminal domain-containing protein [Chitinophagales bacterium]